jgi:hypothetical protein
MLIDYDWPVWRPPSEADSFILQVTLGCSYNRCSFCAMYRTKEFRVRPLAELEAEIDAVARAAPDVRRVFLADGDALAAPIDLLAAVLDRLAARFPDLGRVSCYALPVNFLGRSVAELGELRARKLTLFYYGIETGSADLQRRITKGATPKVMEEGLAKARAAGIKVSATMILGLGGKGRWREHIQETAALVNRVPLNFLSTLILGIDPALEAEFMRKFAEPFVPQDDAGILEELEALVAQLDPPRPLIFRSNHASNALALAGTLPKDKEALVTVIRAARAGRVRLRPRGSRAY